LCLFLIDASQECPLIQFQKTFFSEFAVNMNGVSGEFFVKSHSFDNSGFKVARQVSSHIFSSTCDILSSKRDDSL
jgi:hypothetical protein